MWLYYYINLYAIVNLQSPHPPPPPRSLFPFLCPTHQNGWAYILVEKKLLLIIKNRYLKLPMLVLFYAWADVRIWGSLKFFLRSTSNYLWGLCIQSTGCLILSSWIPLRVHCQWAAAVGYNLTLLELCGEQRSLFFFVHANMNIGVIYIIIVEFWHSRRSKYA